jgi:hypothetical protein
MFAILAVFQAPMFWSNAVAPENACEPSRTLSKSTAAFAQASTGHSSAPLCGRGRRHPGQGPHPTHTPHTQAMAMRAHTLAIVVTAAVFQAPMFALNAVAPENACEPSHTLSKSPRRISPKPRWSVTLGARSVQWAECVRSEVLALDGRDAAQLPRLRLAQNRRYLP